MGQFTIMTVLVLAAISPNTASAKRVLLTHTPEVTPSLLQRVSADIEALGHEVVLPSSSLGRLTLQRQNARARFSQLFSEAKQLFVAEKYKRAIEVLQNEETRSLSLLLPSRSGRAVLVQANLWLGCLHLADREPDNAATRFRLAVSLDQKTKLDPVTWSPEYVSAFNSATTMAAAVGQVSIDLPVAGTTVRIDGSDRPTSDQTTVVSLSVGFHYLLVHIPGKSREAKRISVEPANISSISPLIQKPSPDELAHDVRNMDERWLAENPVWRSSLARGYGASALVVVRNTGVLFYDGQGQRIESLDESPGSTQATLFENASPSEASASPLYTKWWVWTGALAIVAGSVTIWAVSRDSPGQVHGVFGN